MKKKLAKIEFFNSLYPIIYKKFKTLCINKNKLFYLKELDSDPEYKALKQLVYEPISTKEFDDFLLCCSVAEKYSLIPEHIDYEALKWFCKARFAEKGSCDYNIFQTGLLRIEKFIAAVTPHQNAFSHRCAAEMIINMEESLCLCKDDHVKHSGMRDKKRERIMKARSEIKKIIKSELGIEFSENRFLRANYTLFCLFSSMLDEQ